MKKEAIKALDAKELQKNVVIEKESLRKIKFAHAISPVENPLRISYTRRLIARLKTEQRARELKNIQ